MADFRFFLWGLDDLSLSLLGAWLAFGAKVSLAGLCQKKRGHSQVGSFLAFRFKGHRSLFPHASFSSPPPFVRLPPEFFLGMGLPSSHSLLFSRLKFPRLDKCEKAFPLSPFPSIQNPKSSRRKSSSCPSRRRRRSACAAWRRSPRGRRGLRRTSHRGHRGRRGLLRGRRSRRRRRGRRSLLLREVESVGATG